MEGAGEVRIVAVAAHHVGVERDELILSDYVVRSLLKPRVCPLPGIEKSCLHVVSVLRYDRLVQNRPDFRFGQAGLDAFSKGGNSALRSAQRGFDAFQLFE